MNTVLRSTLAALVIAAATLPAQAATQSYTFTGVLDSGAYLGESFSGSFSFDDAPLTGSGVEVLSLDAVSILFHGQTYALNDAAVPPDAYFVDGVLFGLDYTWDAAFPTFSVIAGSTSVDESFLAYDTALIGGSGAGSIEYINAVPDSPGLWLAFAGLGVLGTQRLRRRAR